MRCKMIAGLAAAGVLAFTGSASAAARKVERGITVWRGPVPVESELAGGERLVEPRMKTVIVVKCGRGMRSRVRTQGFYSGHDGASRRYTQGFYSGPPDFRGRCTSETR